MAAEGGVGKTTRHEGPEELLGVLLLPRGEAGEAVVLLHRLEEVVRGDGLPVGALEFEEERGEGRGDALGAERRALLGEDVGEVGGVGEALDDRVHEAGVPEVGEARGGVRAALLGVGGEGGLGDAGAGGREEQLGGG